MEMNSRFSSPSLNQLPMKLNAPIPSQKLSSRQCGVRFPVIRSHSSESVNAFATNNEKLPRLKIKSSSSPPPSPFSYYEWKSVMDFFTLLDDEPKGLLAASLRKQLIKTINMVDVISFLQIARYYPELMTLMNDLGPLVPVIWFLLRFVVLVLLQKEKSKEKSNQKSEKEK